MNAFQQFARNRVSPVLIDEIEVARRTMNQVETDVRADLMRVRVVLDERIQECARAETGAVTSPTK
jgi:hypothetical protein